MSQGVQLESRGVEVDVSELRELGFSCFRWVGRLEQRGDDEYVVKELFRCDLKFNRGVEVLSKGKGFIWNCSDLQNVSGELFPNPMFLKGDNCEETFWLRRGE